MAALSRSFVLRTDDNAQSLWGFLRANWKALAAQGKPLQIVVSQYKATRSQSQNKRYWAILNQIAADAYVGGKQFSAESWAEFFKRKFIGIEELPGGSQQGISTTTLDIGEFGEYMTKIEVYAAQELGIEIL